MWSQPGQSSGRGRGHCQHPQSPGMQLGRHLGYGAEPVIFQTQIPGQRLSLFQPGQQMLHNFMGQTLVIQLID